MTLSDATKENVKHVFISILATAVIALLQYGVSMLQGLSQNPVTNLTSQVGTAFMAIKFWPK